MANLQTTGFLQGFTDSVIGMTRLKLVKDAQDAQMSRDKELLDLRRKEFQGRQAKLQLERMEVLQGLQATQQAQLGRERTVQGIMAPQGPTREAAAAAQAMTPLQRMALESFRQGSQGSAGLIQQAFPREKAFTLGETQTRFAPSGEVLARGAALTAEGTAALPPQTQALVDAIAQNPPLLQSLSADTRGEILPHLTDRGLTFEDFQDPTVRQTRALERGKAQFEFDEAIRKSGGRLRPREIDEFAAKMRRDIRAEPAFRAFNDVQLGLKSVEEGAALNSAVGDLLIINGFAKIKDPGSVVREEEARTVEQAQGLLERLLNTGERFFKGARLRPEKRVEFLEASRNLAQRNAKPYRDTLRQIYQPRAERLGIPFEQLFVEPGIEGRTDLGNVIRADR